MAVEELLGLGEGLAGLAFNRVGRDGERRTREADEGRRAQPFARQTDRLQDEIRFSRRIEALDARQIVDGAQRRASAAALRQLRASYDDLDLFCAHDPAEYAAMGGV